MSKLYLIVITCNPLKCQTSEAHNNGYKFAKATLNSDGTFKLTVSNLNSYTYYYVRAYAINKNGVAYSAGAATFTTERDEPGGDDNQPPKPGVE